MVLHTLYSQMVETMVAKNISEVRERDCSGCGACAQACALSCITMKSDEDGFLFPFVDTDTCVSCGECVKVCPTRICRTHAVLDAYAAINQDDKALKGSSSGAIFPLLAQAWIQEGGYVCAAEMMENMSVKHVLTNDPNALQKMQGSKYVQSDVSDAFKEIKELLNKGKKVMLVGTPCQISGARNLFAKHLEQMLLVDLICHGVPSQGFFRSHIDRTYNHSGRLEQVTFRDKPYYEASSYRLTIKHGATVRHIEPNRDAYYNLFLSSASYRESCYVCKYACAERVGDITLGDCSTTRMYACFPYASTASTVLLSTPTGQHFWDKVSAHTTSCFLNLEEEIRRNSQLHRPSVRPQIRDAVYQDFKDLTKKAFEKKYTYHLTLKQEIRLGVKKLLPLRVKGVIKKLYSTIEKR